MKKRLNSKKIGWWRVAAGVLIGAVSLAAWAYGFYARSLSIADWAAWVSAIGTCLAFAGTIYIANTEARRRRRIDEFDAILAAQSIIDSVTSSYRITKHLRDIFIKRPSNQFKAKGLKSMADKLHQLPKWSNEELRALVFIDGHVGYDLKRARSAIDEAAAFLEITAEIAEEDPEFKDGDEKTLIVTPLDSACELLASVASRCKAIFPTA